MEFEIELCQIEVLKLIFNFLIFSEIFISVGNTSVDLNSNLHKGFGKT